MRYKDYYISIDIDAIADPKRLEWEDGPHLSAKERTGPKWRKLPNRPNMTVFMDYSDSEEAYIQFTEAHPLFNADLIILAIDEMMYSPKADGDLFEHINTIEWLVDLEIEPFKNS